MDKIERPNSTICLFCLIGYLTSAKTACHERQCGVWVSSPQLFTVRTFSLCIPSPLYCLDPLPAPNMASVPVWLSAFTQSKDCSQLQLCTVGYASFQDSDCCLSTSQVQPVRVFLAALPPNTHMFWSLKEKYNSYRQTVKYLCGSLRLWGLEKDHADLLLDEIAASVAAMS